MNDCSNADIRDQLPDLLHDRLTVSVRAVVVAHVAGCVDCSEELELLRGVHGVLMTRTPRVDVAQIVAALPRPSAAPARRTMRTMRMDWRIAAAVTFLAVGGSSMALLNRSPNAAPALPQAPIVAPAVAPLAASSGAAAAVAAAGVQAGSTATASQNVSSDETVASADAQAAADVSPGGRFAGLSEAQLRALLGDIGQLPAVPVTEPEPVSIHVNAGVPTTPDGL